MTTKRSSMLNRVLIASSIALFCVLSTFSGQALADDFYIDHISVRAKTKPHPIVLESTAGKLFEDASAFHVFVSAAKAKEYSGGPIPGKFYKLKFNVTGDVEDIQKMKYVGLTQSDGFDSGEQYIFEKKR